ncbi:MAG: hypothetical protein KAS64_02300 [Spirochaetes bacterium]|nr:hypothetical protein [Spirochaetota bacterium]
MSEKRKKVISEGRGMIRVRYLDDGELSTAAICPGCWNTPSRRRVLIKKLKHMGVEPVHKDDLENGVYREKEHAPECPHKNEKNNAWEKFRSVLKKKKS